MDALTCSESQSVAWDERLSRRE